MNLASRLRRAALSLAHFSGASAAVGRTAWRQRRLTILCYHGLALEDEHLWRPGLYLTPEAGSTGSPSWARRCCRSTNRSGDCETARFRRAR